MTPTVSLFILGSGEIALCLARLATNIGYKISVSDAHTDARQWPGEAEIYQQHYVDQPWELPTGTHAIIARGHEGDPESLACLLNQDTDRVYLIASARRAQNAINEARKNIKDPQRLNKLSAPAGLELGGNGSMEIALSILAEIQMRRYQASGLPLTELRTRGIQKKQSIRKDNECPGKRT